MVLFQFLFILAIVLYLLSVLYFYRFWVNFKKVHIGDTLSKKLSIASRKNIRIALSLFTVGVVLNVITIFVQTT